MQREFDTYLNGRETLVLPNIVAVIYGADVQLQNHDIHLCGTYHRLPDSGVSILYGATISLSDVPFLFEDRIRVQIFPDTALDEELGSSCKNTKYLKRSGLHALTRTSGLPDMLLRSTDAKDGRLVDIIHGLPKTQRNRVLARSGVLALSDRMWIHGTHHGATQCLFNGSVEELLNHYVLSQHAEEAAFYEFADAMCVRQQEDRVERPVGAITPKGAIQFTPITGNDYFDNDED